MKKIIVPVFILSIITWSCNKENSTPVQVEETTGWHTVTLNASVDSEITKTAYAGDKTFSWSEGDQISVLFHNPEHPLLQLRFCKQQCFHQYSVFYLPQK